MGTKITKFFTLTFKKAGLVFVAWFVLIILHNAFYAVFGIEEALFFIFAVIIIPLYLIISIIVTLAIFIKYKIK